MRSLCSMTAMAVLVLFALASPARAQAPSTPVALAIDGTLAQQGTGLPWPPNPAARLFLDVRVRTTISASSSAAGAAPELVQYFNATTDASGFTIIDAAGPLLIGWKGRWTNRAGFLLEGGFAGQRTGVVSQTPPVIALAGTAGVEGLSGRGRGVVLTGSWSGQLNTQTGALRIALAGPAVGALGPPKVACGPYDDPSLAGDLQPLMTKPDGSVNRDHFSRDANDPYPHPFSYSTNPPTSGPHDDFPVIAGIYDTPLDDEALVHSLEHGIVIVGYLPSLAPAIVARLAALVEIYPDDVILAPRPANDVPIALTSWGRLLKFTEYDEPAIQNFIDRNRAHGPECFE